MSEARAPDPSSRDEGSRGEKSRILPHPAAKPGAAGPVRPTESLADPSLYNNRELSLLEFHHRVLAQAMDPNTPILERLRFLTITSSILDEFFEIRVGALKEQLAFALPKPGPDGLSPGETLRRARAMVKDLVAEQYRVLDESLLPELRAQGIVLYDIEDLNEDQRSWVREHFRQEVLPVLTPIGLDPAHPFPRIVNKSLNFIVSLDGKDAFGRRSRAAVIQA
ncbi:MAG: hypothetical protein HKN12_06145, partial [Gemmatimonadetes bacterium]|nr:hypothetical protein [Gemmatimonadota bacterium]